MKDLTREITKEIETTLTNPATSYKSYKLFELIPLSSFIALLKFTEMCAFQMRHNNVSQEGVLALALSLAVTVSPWANIKHFQQPNSR